MENYAFTDHLLGNYALTNSPEDDKYTQMSRRKTRHGYILIQDVKSIVNKCISTLSLEKYCHWENKYFSEFSYMLFLAASSYFYKDSSSTLLPVSHVTLQDWMNSSVATHKQAFISKFLSQYLSEITLFALFSILRVQAVVILAGRALCQRSEPSMSRGRQCHSAVPWDKLNQVTQKGIAPDSFSSALVIIPPPWPCLYVTVHQEVLLGTSFIFDSIELFPHKKIVWKTKMREYLLWRGSAWLAAPGSESCLMLRYLGPPALRGK